jgi:hypothetical protein
MAQPTCAVRLDLKSLSLGPIQQCHPGVQR